MLNLDKVSVLVQSLFKTDELLEKVQQQLKKDFVIFDEMDQLVINCSNEKVFKAQLSEVLSNWSKKDPEQFMHCIYMVDLPEHITKGFYQSRKLSWEELVDYIFRREVLKIYLRAKFSAQ